MDRGYPRNFKEKLLSQIKLKERKSVLLKQTKRKKKTQYQPLGQCRNMGRGWGTGREGRGEGAGSPNNFDKHV